MLNFNKCPQCETGIIIHHHCNICDYYERKKKVYAESAEQGTIASYIKRKYPDIIFHTTRVEGKKEFWEQNQIKKLNSHSGFPDTFILQPLHGYGGLMIENKKFGTKLFKVDGQFASEHYRNQYITHQKLIQAGYAVYFAVGISNAIEILESFICGNLKPFLKVDLKMSKQDQLADDFFSSLN